MKVFVTGASGWIGSAVVDELLSNGHDVIGLARSDASAATLEAKGVTVMRGDIDDIAVLTEATRQSDGVIHLAFKHDIAFSGQFLEAAQADRAAVEAFAAVLEGTDKPLTIASGVMGLTPGKLLTEQDGHGASMMFNAQAVGPKTRWETAEYTLSLAARGIRSSIVRLAPTNHGDGDNGFMTSIVQITRDKGVSGYVGDGTNRWTAVHRLDSAHLFCLAIEKAPAGTTLHAVAEEGIAIKDIAEVIGKQLDVPVESIPPERADEHFSWMARFIGSDSPASSTATRGLLDWEPTHLTLLEDLGQDYYFKQ